METLPVENSNIRALIFDFGGVLVQGSAVPTLTQFGERLGLPVERWIESLFGTAWREADGIGAWLLRKVLLLMETLWQRYYGARWLQRDVLELIEQMQGRYQIALLSNASDQLERLLSEPLGIRHLFDAVVVSAQEGVAKPNPAIYQVALDRLGITPEQALFVDDMDLNTSVASRIGMDTITYRASFDLRLQLKLRGLL